MTIRTLFLRGAFNLGAGQVVVQLCTFARSVILARLISPENFGIAAAFAMTYSLLEMVSNLSAQSLIVQAPDGDDPGFQATGHLLLAVRGVTNSAVLLILAAPLSFLFGVPQAKWAFYWLAAIPLAKGFEHLDISRLQREMRFTPRIIVDIISNVLVTLIAFPLAAWLRDYSSMLWLLLFQAALYMLFSHIVAKRRYAWAWSSYYANRYFVFGWPLLVNGLLMYGIFQGDRFIIGIAHRIFPKSIYTLTDLGVYSVAFAVTMAPSQFFVNLASSLFLPVLSSAQSSREQFRKRYLLCVHLLSVSTLIIAIPFMTVGRFIVPIVYGSKYLAAEAIIPWLGAMWALRVFRAGPTLAAMALGDTQNAMFSNIARTTSLAGMIIVAATGGSLYLISLCGFIGEILATVICLGRLSSKNKLSSGLVFRPIFVCTVSMVLAGISKIWVVSFGNGICTAILLLSASFAIMLLYFPELRHYLRTVLSSQHLSINDIKWTN